MSTSTIVIAVLVVLAVIVAVLLAVAAMRRSRSRGLRDRFGPEYQRVVEETGDRRQAERVLDERIERRRQLEIHDLDPATRERYVREWHAVQSRFVDDPKGAVGEADDLVTSLMRDRGYPTEGFDERLAVVSVDHAEAVDEYRHAHEVLAAARDQVATDDLRQAMVHFRRLFEQLVGEPARPVGPAETIAGRREPGREEDKR